MLWMVEERISKFIASYFNYRTVAYGTQVNDHSKPILISANHAISGEIFCELPRYP
jgi:hypothetical protein